MLIENSQRDYQRIVWRFSVNDPMRSYRLRTLTYGTSPAPYLAIRTLKQLAFDISEKYPIASNIILYCMYMDDAVSGASSIDELIRIYYELKNEFNSAGMNLRKWCSNSTELLQIIPESKRELKACDNSIKMLGVSWSPTNDIITFNFNFSIDSNSII